MTADPARRLAEHPRWRWMPGMLAVYSDRVRDRVYDDRARDAVPDLTDPATAGCLVAMLREASSDPGMGARQYTTGRWYVTGPSTLGARPLVRCADTEGEALAAALLELWGRER